ncbi:LPXTG cell wall anchor domain-containing protein [Dactylosporangium sp. NPDC051484]|uniref:LPXTG cell wall anchor domain-containing protein n=1 Tax=Dactylosporangium sp. NPDC051484 TaxID=3154942 RepID=UPI00344F92D0
MERPPRRAARRFAVALAAVALAFAAAPAGSARAEEAPRFTVSAVSEIAIGSDGIGKTIFYAATAVNAANPRFTIDVSQVAAFATLTPIDDDICAVAGGKVTCALPGGSYDNFLVSFILAPAGGAKVGAKGTLSLVAKAGNTAEAAAVTKVTVADGFDLVAIDGSDGEQPAKPGDDVWIPATYVNEGNRDADDSAFTFWFDSAFVPDEYDGCTYTDWKSGVEVTCPLGESLKPGEGATFVTEGGSGQTPGFHAKITADAARYHRVGFTADPSAGGLELAQSLRSKVSSKKATGGRKFSAVAKAKPPARARSVEINDYDNYADTEFKVANTIDIAGIGATAAGAAGDVVKVKIGTKNVGKGTVDAHYAGGDPSWRYYLVVPDGAEVVAVPDECDGLWRENDATHAGHVAGKRFYECANRDELFSPGASATVEFGIKITQVIANATGTVSFQHPLLPEVVSKDDNPANDLAEVVLNPAGSGGGSGGGGALPLTGAQTGLVITVGAALLAAGAVLFVLTRRRPVVLVTPRDGGAQ